VTRQEIDILWQRALVAAIAEGEPMTRYHFAEMLLDCYSRTENTPTLEELREEKSAKFEAYVKGFKDGWGKKPDSFNLTDHAVKVEWDMNKVLNDRKEFLRRLQAAGYHGLQHYIESLAQMCDVPLDVARSAFQIGSYPEAFTGFIDELKKYKLTKKGAVTCYQT